MLVQVPGTDPTFGQRILMYGHMDKQPPLLPWDRMPAAPFFFLMASAIPGTQRLQNPTPVCEEMVQSVSRSAFGCLPKQTQRSSMEGRVRPEDTHPESPP